MLRKGIVKNSINFPNQWKIELYSNRNMENSTRLDYM